MLQKFFPDLTRRELVLRCIVCCGLLGMLCILMSSFLPEKKAEQKPVTNAESYRISLETQLHDLLEAMEGVGEVKVLVTLTGGEEYRYAKAGENSVSDSQTRNSMTYVTVGSGREALLESVANPAITGVVVACTGGSSPVVQETVYRAVSVVCGLPAGQVYVTKLAE